MNKPAWIITDKVDKAQLDYLRKQKLFLATPAYGGLMCSTFTQSYGSLVALCARTSTSLATCFLANESLVQRARNILCAEFLKSDATHLLFVDADIGFEARDILSMLLADKQIIGGPYTKKTINFKAALEAFAKGVPLDNLGHCAGDFVVRYEGKTQIELFNPTEVKYLGTGFLLVKREVLETLKPFVANYKQNSSNKPGDIGARHYAFFDCAVVNDEYLSEDYWFCHKAKEQGIPLYLAPWIHLTHTGTHTHNGCLMCTYGTLIHQLGQPTK